MAHTPGPWFVDPLRLGVLGDVSTQDGSVIAQAQQVAARGRDQEREDNARLIAAAPELLEALEWIAPLLNAVWDEARAITQISLNQGKMHSLNAAIAKARGK